MSVPMYNFKEQVYVCALLTHTKPYECVFVRRLRRIASICLSDVEGGVSVGLVESKRVSVSGEKIYVCAK